MDSATPDWPDKFGLMVNGVTTFFVGAMHAVGLNVGLEARKSGTADNIRLQFVKSPIALGLPLFID